MHASTPMNEPTCAPAPARRVTLAQYAGVTAGLGEGVPLEIVLANEGVAPDLWPRAEAAWDDRLSDGDDALRDELDRLLAAAQERYGRPVTPLDSDLEAWLGFVRRFGAEEQPLAWLASLGLRHTDVLRLHRRWARRLADEPALQREAARMLDQEPGPLPRIAAGERTIARPEARLAGEAIELPEDPIDDEPGEDLDDADDAQGEGALEPDLPDAIFGPLPGEAPALPGGMTLAQYASLCAELNQSPHAVEAIFARHGLADRQARAAADLAWKDHLRHHPAAYAEWQQLYAHYAAYWADPQNAHAGAEADARVGGSPRRGGGA